MKRIVANIGAVIFLSAGLYILIIFFFTLLSLNRWLPNARNTTGRGYYTYSRLQELQNVNDIDILFVGSSHMYRGVDTRVFGDKGITTFNLGTSGQTPYNTYYLLKEHLDHIQPETIVMDLYLEGMNSDGVSATIEIVSNHELTENMLSMASRNIKFETVSSLFSIYISRLHTPLSKVKEVKPKDDTYVSGGYIETNRLVNELTPKQLSNLRGYKLRMNDLQKTYLSKIIELCDDSNINLVFVVPPITNEFRTKIENYEMFLEDLQALLKSEKRPLLDYNSQTPLQLDTFRDFLDANHLNPNGAVIFSNKLYEDLNRRGFVKTSSI